MTSSASRALQTFTTSYSLTNHPKKVTKQAFLSSLLLPAPASFSASTSSSRLFSRNPNKQGHKLQTSHRPRKGVAYMLAVPPVKPSQHASESDWSMKVDEVTLADAHEHFFTLLTGLQEHNPWSSLQINMCNIRSGIGVVPFSTAMCSASISRGSASTSSYSADLRQHQLSDGVTASFAESVLI
jgi:hypothetical protein